MGKLTEVKWFAQGHSELVPEERSPGRHAYALDHTVFSYSYSNRLNILKTVKTPFGTFLGWRKKDPNHYSENYWRNKEQEHLSNMAYMYNLVGGCSLNSTFHLLANKTNHHRQLVLTDSGLSLSDNVDMSVWQTTVFIPEAQYVCLWQTTIADSPKKHRDACELCPSHFNA